VGLYKLCEHEGQRLAQPKCLSVLGVMEVGTCISQEPPRTAPSQCWTDRRRTEHAKAQHDRRGTLVGFCPDRLRK
jgi:hypothetical protein